MGYKLLDFLSFKFLTMINTIVGARAVVAGAGALRLRLRTNDAKT
jgi:hypothetical protein